MAPRRIAASALFDAIALVGLVAVDQPLAAEQPAVEQPAAPVEPASGRERVIAVFAGVRRLRRAARDARIGRCRHPGLLVNLGRFDVIARTERFTSGDLKPLSRRSGKPREGQAASSRSEVRRSSATEELIAKLRAATVVAIPAITYFESGYNDARAQFEATVKTRVAFLDVAAGSVLTP
jgi:hypothetical protein